MGFNNFDQYRKVCDENFILKQRLDHVKEELRFLKHKFYLLLFFLLGCIFWSCIYFGIHFF